MNPLKIIRHSLKQRGLAGTASRIFQYLKKFLNRLPIWLTYYKLKIAKTWLARNQARRTKVLQFQVEHQDIKSLYIEFKDIFKNQIYYFQTDTAAPKIIDGGSFIGLSALYFKYLYPQAKITAFEPSQDVLKLLRKNLVQNKITDIEVVEKGLGANDQAVAFAVSPTDAGKISPDGQTKIQITKLSHYINDKVDFVKLNIEGAELDVLQDLAANHKFQFIDQLCIEWHSFSNQPQNLDQGLKILNDHGYKYLINHFDYQTNRAVKPPFKLENKTQYYLLIYAKKI